MLVNFVGARRLIEQALPKMPEGSAIAYVASNLGLGWQQHLGTLTGLVECEGFGERARLCEVRADRDRWRQCLRLLEAGHQCVGGVEGGRLPGQGRAPQLTNPGPTDTPMMPFFHKSYGKAIIDAAVGPLARYSTPRNRRGRSCS